MLYTAILCFVAAAVMAGLKWLRVDPFSGWEWWQTAVPAIAMGAILVIIFSGSVVHAIINKLGWRDGGGTD